MSSSFLRINGTIAANDMNCAGISKNGYELYNISVGIIKAQRNVLAMKRPVPLYDFTAFGNFQIAVLYKM